MEPKEFNILPISKALEGKLQFSPITINPEYRKKWNINCNDFIVLTKNGELVNNNLYRNGGFNYPNLEKDRYFMLLKYVEAYYASNITKITKSDPKHLEGRWCILNREGIEKVEVGAYRSLYYTGGIIYSSENKVYNIETKEYYGDSYNSIKSDNFLFLSQRFNPDESKRGVLKININDGTTELFQ